MFLKSFIPNVKIIAPREFELAYYYAAVQYVSHNATKRVWWMKERKKERFKNHFRELISALNWLKSQTKLPPVIDQIHSICCIRSPINSNLPARKFSCIGMGMLRSTLIRIPVYIRQFIHEYRASVGSKFEIVGVA